MAKTNECTKTEQIDSKGEKNDKKKSPNSLKELVKEANLEENTENDGRSHDPNEKKKSDKYLKENCNDFLKTNIKKMENKLENDTNDLFKKRGRPKGSSNKIKTDYLKKEDLKIRKIRTKREFDKKDITDNLDRDDSQQFKSSQQIPNLSDNKSHESDVSTSAANGIPLSDTISSERWVQISSKLRNKINSEKRQMQIWNKRIVMIGGEICTMESKPLPNPKNHCFLNVILQFFMREGRMKSEVKLLCSFFPKPEGNATLLLHKLLELCDEKPENFILERFLHLASELELVLTDQIDKQQDAWEILQIMIAHMKTKISQMPKVFKDSLFLSNFTECIFEVEDLCISCNKHENRKISMSSIPLPKGNSVSNAIKHLFDEELINDYQCDYCMSKTRAKRILKDISTKNLL